MNRLCAIGASGSKRSATRVVKGAHRGDAPQMGIYSPAGDASSHRTMNNKGTQMKNKAVKIGIIATIAPHIFCCGLPLILAVVGLIAPDAAHFHLLPHWLEPWLFVFSGIMLGVSWWLILRDCGCKCKHCDASQSHRTQKFILGIITVVFFISIVLHFISHH
ncbi:MAG: hypothetical protein ACLRFN_01330 [Alphaproteobacteria bacterium]